MFYTIMNRFDVNYNSSENNHPNPVTNPEGLCSDYITTIHEQNMIRICQDGRKRMGLFPVDIYHIDKDANPHEVNTKKFREHRIKAAKEFLIKELKYKYEIKIVQSKWNMKESILWIETEDEESVQLFIISQLMSEIMELNNKLLS